MLVISPHLVTDKVYLHKAVKHAIKCGVIDQWMLVREQGFLPKERADPTGEQYEVRFITEKEYRTLPDAILLTQNLVPCRGHTQQAGRVHSVEQIRLASAQGWSILCNPPETCQSI